MKYRKWIIAIVFLIAIGFIFSKILPGMLFASGIPNPSEVPLDKEIASRLVKELDEYGKIYELDDCKRHSKSINGVPIRMNEEETNDEYGQYYKDVLKKLEINEFDFERFRKSLEDTKLRNYIRTEKYSVFIVDGFLDNVWGYFYTHNIDNIDSTYFKADIYSIKIVEDLGDNWYRIGGS